MVDNKLTCDDAQVSYYDEFVSPPSDHYAKATYRTAYASQTRVMNFVMDASSVTRMRMRIFSRCIFVSFALSRRQPTIFLFWCERELSTTSQTVQIGPWHQSSYETWLYVLHGLLMQQRATFVSNTFLREL